MPRIVSLLLDDEQLSAGVFAIDPCGQVTLENFTVEEAHPEGKSPPLSERAERLLKALPPGDVVLGLSGHAVWLKWMNTVRVKEAEWGRVADFEASQVIPGKIETMIWTTIVRQAGEELEIIVAAAKKEKIEASTAALAQVNRGLKGIFPAGLTLLNTLLWVHPGMRVATLLLTLQAGTAHLLWWNGDDCYGRTITLGPGTNSATKDAALRVSRLVSEVARASAMNAFPHALLKVEKVFLVGGGALTSDLMTGLASALAVAVEILPVGKKLGAIAVAHAEHENTIALLTGLALHEKENRLNQLNLHKVARKPVRVWAVRIEKGIAAAMFIAAVMLPLVNSAKRNSRLTRAAVAIENELGPLRAGQTNSANVRGRFEAVQQAEQAWRAWDVQQTVWKSFLADLQEIVWLTENTWLDEFTVVRAADAQRASIKIELRGRWFDPAQPLSEDGPAGRDPLAVLFHELASCEGVVGVENERFERASRGVMAFSCTLVLDERSGL